MKKFIIRRGEKIATLRLKDVFEFQRIAKALSSDSRASIYKLLQRGPLNIKEISLALNMPKSTASVNLKKLERAGLVTTETSAAEKGGEQKVCSLTYDQILFSPPSIGSSEHHHQYESQMPVGHFVKFEITPPCGLSTNEEVIGTYDYVPSFYDPQKVDAQILWFEKGFIEYHFPNELPTGASISKLSFSGELCSEYKGYKNDYLSDITLWVNGIEIGTWTSPGDFGGKRGKYTPSWWKTRSTQFGILVEWKILENSTSINGQRVDNVDLSQINFDLRPFISIRLGVKEDAKNIGGLNIFGAKFGNYNQNLRLTIDYLEKKDNLREKAE